MDRDAATPAAGAAFTWQPEIRAVDEENPWPGLDAFRETDERFFHGRESEADLLLALIRRARLTVLCGVPGFGKTSLLQAAIFPRLRAENHLPVYLRLDHGDGAPAPREQALAAIAAAVTAAKVDAPAVDASTTLWEYFHRRGAEFWSPRNQPVVPVLILDQFEEAFTLGRSAEERWTRTREFLTELGDLIEGRVPAPLRDAIDRDPAAAAGYAFTRHNYKVVLSLREDYLAELESLRKEIPAVGENRLRLERMRGTDAVRAVTQAGGRLIAAGMAERIVRFAAGGKSEAEALERITIEPWLLSLVCSELNKRRRERQAAQISTDLLESSQAEILANFYEGCVKDLDPSVRRFIEEHLLTESGERDSEALANAPARGVVMADLYRLIDRRLLRVEDRGGRPRVELTHDVLAPVVQLSRDVRRRHEGQAAAAALERAQLRRRVRRMAAVAAVLAVVIVAAGVFAYDTARKRREVQRAMAKMALHQAETARDENRSDVALANLAHSLRQNGGSAVASALLVSTLIYDRVHSEVLFPVGPRLRHEGRIGSASFSRDGTRAITASDDGTAQVWEAASGVRLGPPLRHARPVHAAAFERRQGRYAVTASADGTAQVWEVGSGRPVGAPLAHAGEVLWAAFAQDRVVTAAADGTVSVWGPGGERVGNPLRHTGPVRLAQLTGDGRTLLTVAADAAQVWELVSTGADEEWQRLGQPMRHRAPVLSGQFSRGRQFVVTTSADHTAQVWELIVRSTGETWKAVGEALAHEGPVVWAMFDRRAGTVATASQDGSARLWHLAGSARGKGRHWRAGAVLRHGGPVQWVEFSRDNRWLLTASADGHARIWEVATGTLVGRALDHGAPLTTARFSPDGRGVLTASTDGTAQLWRGKPIGEPLAALEGPITAAGFAAGATHLVSVSDQLARVWRIPGGDAVGQPVRYTAPTVSTVLDPAARRIISIGDKRAEVVDLASGRPIGTPLTHAATVTSAAFSPDGRRILTGSADRTAQLWEASGAGDDATWEKVGKTLPHVAAVSWVAFDGNGARAATVSTDRTVRVWDLATGDQLGKPRESDGGVRSAVFSADGARLVTASWDGTARIWEVDTNESIAGSLRHEMAATFATFSPDDRWVATASMDNTARIWDARFALPASVPFAHADRVLAARFSDDARWLYTVSADGGVRRWELLSAADPDDAPVLADLADAVGGTIINEQGGESDVKQVKTPAQLRAAAAAGSATLRQFLEWYFTAPGERPTSPSSDLRLADAVARIENGGTPRRDP